MLCQLLQLVAPAGQAKENPNILFQVNSLNECTEGSGDHISFHVHGWGANWLSGWPSHDREFASNAFSLAENERVAGLIYIGIETSRPPERPRPNLQNIVTWL